MKLPLACSILLSGLAMQAFAASNVDWTDPDSGLKFRFVGNHNHWTAKEACKSIGTYWVLPSADEVNKNQADRLTRLSSFADDLLNDDGDAKWFRTGTRSTGHCFPGGSPVHFVYVREKSSAIGLELQCDDEEIATVCLYSPFERE